MIVVDDDRWQDEGRCCGLKPDHEGCCGLKPDHEGCCGLKPDHEGCCAYFCSMCNGTGRCAETNIDDLGCSCGFCDGYGYCSECSGQGWFNEAGEPCWVGADEWGRVVPDDAARPSVDGGSQAKGEGL